MASLSTAAATMPPSNVCKVSHPNRNDNIGLRIDVEIYRPLPGTLASSNAEPLYHNEAHSE